MIIDGERLAREKEAELKPLVKPGLSLGIIVFDDDQAGQTYSRLKAEAGARLGIRVIKSNTEKVLEQWNQDKSIQGIMIQKPAYRGEEWERRWEEMVGRIKREKDVDGLREDSPFIQATVKAVELLIGDERGKIVVIGRGMVGRKLGQRLGVENLSSRDEALRVKTLAADILISATGREKLITAEMVKPGALVIDVGWPKGDVDFEAVKNIAGKITPVPGGVGPLSVVCLLENLIKSQYT